MQVKEHFDIIIIGAGAAGLCAARELTRVKMKILILEARDRIGGRMYTNTPKNFKFAIERGAEFIHGEASYTFQLLTEADAERVEIHGNTYQVNDKNVHEEDFFDQEWNLVLEKLEALTDDLTFEQFLSTYFADAKYGHLRDKVTKFVEGYNAADITKVSSLALREEWSEDDDPSQYRITGGYRKLYDFLASEVRQNGGSILLEKVVTQINWKAGAVQVSTDSETFEASKCLVTVPVSILNSDRIRFEPAVPQIQDAASKIGFGGVVKIILEFSFAFWETEPEKKLIDLQFLFSDEKIPTWWSQFPDRIPILTGWVGGPAAGKVSDDDQHVLDDAIHSLARAMNYPKDKIRQHLTAWQVDRWSRDTFSNGAYSYAVLGTREAITVLETPIDNTLYFCGEAIYTGTHRSTVEAALVSGRDAAKNIHKNFI